MAKQNIRQSKDEINKAHNDLTKGHNFSGLFTAILIILMLVLGQAVASQ